MGAQESRCVCDKNSSDFWFYGPINCKRHKIVDWRSMGAHARARGVGLAKSFRPCTLRQIGIYILRIYIPSTGRSTSEGLVHQLTLVCTAFDASVCY